MVNRVIEELLENLVYNAVVHYREELESSEEWCRVKEEFETLGRELKSCLCANTSAEAEEKVKKLFAELMDRHVYLMNLAELNAYKSGLQDGARLILMILSGDVAKT